MLASGEIRPRMCQGTQIDSAIYWQRGSGLELKADAKQQTNSSTAQTGGASKNFGLLWRT
jgi:hypothetical protein